jgi:hypothetical protein
MDDRYNDPFSTHIESDDFTLSLGSIAELPNDPPQIVRAAPESHQTTTWDFLGALMLDLSYIVWLLLGALVGVAVRIVGRVASWWNGRGGVGY